MAPRWTSWSSRALLFTTALLLTGANASNILTTSGFTDCGSDATVTVQKLQVTYDSSNRTVIFDVAGSSTKQQNVTAHLAVTAYGNQVYERSFDPCSVLTFVQQLCPLPVGNFAAKGSQQIPESFAQMIPAVAFSVPDVEAQARLELQPSKDSPKIACIEASITNGKTISIPAVSYVAAGVAGVAFLVTGASAAGAALGGTSASSATAAGTLSPSFTEVFGWFQGLAMSGMLSVNYPDVYLSFSKNFAFSVGLVPWAGMLSAIDKFRATTGGNLTNDNVEYIASTKDASSGLLHFKRAIVTLATIAARDIETSVNTTDKAAQPTTTFQQKIQGIEAFARKVSVPKSDIFMTALLVVAIIIASIVLGILLIKVILEAWAIWGTFPESLKGFRKHYWGSIARTITSLIMLLYGVWVLYCIFQLSRADSSWAAKALAIVTLAIFTGVLAFFTWKIYSTVRRLKAAEGDSKALYENKELWMKYSLFYDAYSRQYWWLFVPTIIYMFAKGVCIAAGDGHGMQQTAAQLIIEAIMLVLLLWSRPYERRSGNVLNIVIQVIRVLSVGCILVFVEEFGIAQTTKTVTGVVLIVVQSTLTGVLVILIIWNAIQVCITTNPHRKRRKEMEKRNRERDTLTPLDANNSLLPRHENGSRKSISSLSTIESKDKNGFVEDENCFFNRRVDIYEPLTLPDPEPFHVDTTATRNITHNEPRSHWSEHTTRAGQ